MQVNSVKSCPTFSAQTKKGNEYEKCNEGKKIIPIVGLTEIALLANLNKKAKESYGFFINKEKPLVSVVATIAILGALYVGLGAILDSVINKTRRKDADKFAETGEVPEKTNKGKNVCVSIGLGMGLVSLLSSRKPLKSMDFQDFLVVPSELIAWGAAGVIYDNAVNKFRNKATNKEN